MNTELKYKSELLEYLKTLGTILIDVPLKNHTTFKCGGNADILLYPEKTASISKIIKIICDEDIPLTVIGGGSNLLVGDKGIRGIVLRICDDSLVGSTLSIEDDTIYSDASVPKSDFIDFALEAGFKGIEFMTGIPGTVGGGIVMNAGTDLGAFIEILDTVNIVDCRGIEKSIKVKSEMFSYRKFYVEENAVVTGAYFNLKKSGNITDTRKRIEKILIERNSKHPVHLPSAGSVFKNPDGYSSWKLVDDAGLKGMRIGGAMVSELHTNFIVNIENASSADVRDLINLIQEQVNSKFGVKLDTEIRSIGEF